MQEHRALRLNSRLPLIWLSAAFLAALLLPDGVWTTLLVGFGGLFLGFLVGGLLAVLFGYLSAVAIVNFVREDRLGAAFDVGVVKDVALSKEFAVPWLLSIAVFVAAGLLNVVPLLGTLLAVFANFYAAIVAADLWAGGFTRARETDRGRGRTEIDESVV
jgi:hypothetical protein